MATRRGWKRLFDEPIPLPRGPPARHARGRGQIYPETAGDRTRARGVVDCGQNLINAAEVGGGWLMLARIGVMRALNRHVERVFNPDRKDTHWGRRKLKRDA